MKNKNLLFSRIIKIKQFKFITIFLLIVGVFLLPKSSALASTITPENLIKLTNKERIKYNLSPLSLNDKLKKAAINKTNSLLTEQYFAHTSPQGKTFSLWIKEADYKFIYAGENLAMDFMTAEGVMKAWMKSKSHRKNILNPFYNEIAIATKKGDFKDRPTIMIAQLFGRRKKNTKKLTLLTFNNTKNKNTNKIITPAILSYNEGIIIYLNKNTSIKKISFTIINKTPPFKETIKIVQRPLLPRVAGESTINSNIGSSIVILKNISLLFSLFLMFLTAIIASYLIDLIYKFNYPLINL